MNWRNRKVIFGIVALTALGIAGASLAAQGTEKAADETANTAVVDESDVETVESVGSDDENEVETESEADVDSETEAESEVGDSSEDAAENEAPIVGTDLDRASAIALEYTGGGKVTGTEVGDEESYYEVEVTLDDGRQIDVQLDEAFNVVGTDTD